MNSKAIRKQLLAAVAMVLVAAVALGSSTYAWFVGNNTVKAQGMKVQAQAESGILIKSVENNSDTFSTIANANMATGTKLYPTSTIDLKAWYHAVSDLYDDEKSGQDAGNYTSVTDSLASYAVKRTFVIRSADAKLGLDGMDLAVTEVKATNSTTNTVLLDEAVRVGVKVTGEDDDEFFVYAPRKSGNFTLTATYASDAEPLVEKTAPVAAGDRLPLTNHSYTIPASTDGLVVEVYIWYEGEDEQCKTSNLPITTAQDVDELSVTVSFKAIAKA